MTTRDKLLEILKKQNVCCNGNECGQCKYDGDNCVEERLADTLIESGLIKDEAVYSPIAFIEEDMKILDVICPKCNKLVSMVELSTIGNPYIDPKPKIEEVKDFSQLHYKYCMYCGCKLKE